jgi:UDP-3-O-[3-hydroxymyristoyl] N-acetylglucosamine deacetylase
VIRLEGVGLHGGRRSAIVVSASPGPTTIGCAGACATLAEIDLVGGDRASIATIGSIGPNGGAGVKVQTIEHLLAAIVGLGAFAGVHVEIEGDEVPLLDGGSLAFARAIDAVCPAPPRAFAVRVVRETEIAIDDARYHFVPLVDPEATSIEVEIDYPAARFGRPLRGRASWDGDRRTFLRSIAPARTFGAARELEPLRARGLAAHVPEGAVVALDLADPVRAPVDESEPVRHKLLDLLGDLAPLGGPLRGRLFVTRPSHRMTQRVRARMLEEGIVVR